ncbi:MAG: hypothetical protein JSS72_00645 [Armatimonadetes bacterium]|nr:hypothetical protein [Armatimonadota bacterium]
MKRVLLLGVVFSLVAGCGGMGSLLSSPFAGNYAGSFTTSDSQHGTATFAVASDGTITGTVNNVTTGGTGSLTGTINPVGNVNASLAYTSTTFSLVGTGSFNGSNQLIITVVETGNGTTATLTFTMSPQ